MGEWSELTEPDLKRLKVSPEVAWYCESRGIAVPDCPPLHKTPEPRNEAGARFDPVRVDRVIAVFCSLQHTKGRLAGQPLKPDPWQVVYILAPTFGWVHFDEDLDMWVRIIRTLYVDMPRKQGKSTLAGGIGIYLTCADGEAGAQVVAAATRLEQAQFVFAPIKQLADKSAKLKRHTKTFKNKIVHTRTSSYFQPVANAGDAQHGADLHGGIIDELHLHKTNDLVEAIETGTGSRAQPLIVFITTADAGRKETAYDRKRTLVEKLARGVLHDQTTYGVVFGVDPATPTEELFSEDALRKANPGYGVSPTRAYLRQKANQARTSEADLASYKRLHLGIRTKQATRYLNMDAWDRNASIVDETRLKGRMAFGGLDLAATSDLSALCWVFPDEEFRSFELLWRLWTPDANLESLDARTAGAATGWANTGVLTVTPGNVADYDFIEAQITKDSTVFDVREIAYDRWNATQLVNDLVADGAPMVQMGQGFQSMSAPTKELQRLMLSGTAEKPVLRHGGNPAMRWMVDNFAVAMDPSGNVKPDKANAGEKIDGVVALIMGLSRAIEARPDGESAYEDHDLMIV